MEIQRLKSDVITKIRSAFTVNSVMQCVAELVLNSLDAKSTSIAVRINFVTFRIQIVDNGEGISKENLELVGLRYMTNKCKSLNDLEKHVKYYGFRGEALASIINISQIVNITSKQLNSSETFSKNIGKHVNNRITASKDRPSCGTTVTVEGFLHTLPVRRKRIVQELEIENIKTNIEYLAIIYPNVSFSIRNDVTGNLILNSKKCRDIISSFKNLHPQINEEHFLVKVSKSKVTIEALVFKGLNENKNLQYIYVNKRPVYCSKIQKFFSSLFIKNQKFEKKKLMNNIVESKNKYPMYVLYIKCPHSFVDILLNTSKTHIEFKNWDIILRCIERLINSFFGNKNSVPTTNKYLTILKDFKSECGVSQIGGAFKSFGYKRKSSDDNDLMQLKRKILSRENTANDIFADTQYSQLQNQNGNLKWENKVESLKTMPKEVQCVSKNSVKIDISNNDTEINRISENVDVSNDYKISNITPITKTRVKKFRKPLPIKRIQNKKRSSDENVKKSERSLLNMNISPEVGKAELKTNSIEIPEDAPQSSLTKFTDDENKGKSLILDMFLKSTQVYNSQDNNSEPRSEETILEVESNFLLENNIQTNIKGMSKTMSVSVNVKSTKRYRRLKSKANKSGVKNMVSKCIQTTIDENRFQTPNDHRILGNNKSKYVYKENNDFFNEKTLSENCTIVVDDKSPYFKFAYPPLYPTDAKLENGSNFSNSKCCICNCHARKYKIFKFDKEQQGYKKELKNKHKNPLSEYNLDEINISPISKCHVGSHASVLRTKILNSELELGRGNLTEKCVLNTKQVLKRETRNFEGMQNRLKIADDQHKLLRNNFIKIENSKQQISQKNLEYDKSPYFANNKNYLFPKSSNWKKNCKEENYYKYDNQENIHIPNFANYENYCNYFHPIYQSTQLPYYNNNLNVHQLTPGIIKNFNLHQINSNQENLNNNYDNKCTLYNFKRPLENSITAHNKNVLDISYEDLHTLHDFTIDCFDNFKPMYKSTQHDSKRILKNYDLKGDFHQESTIISTPTEFNNNIENGEQYEHAISVLTNQVVQDEPIQSYQTTKTLLNHDDQTKQNIVNISDGDLYTLHNFTIENFNNFNPMCESTQYDLKKIPKNYDVKEDFHQENSIFTTPTEFNNNIIENGEQYENTIPILTNRDLPSFQTIINHGDQTKLFITLSNGQKQDILERKLNVEKELNGFKHSEWDDPFALSSKEDKEKESLEIENEWLRKQNKFGSNFYINKKTGFTTFLTPKPDINNFQLNTRFEFMPRGMSPILKEIKEVDKSLSQNKKDKLYNYIIETYQDELLLIKWQHYIKDNDPQKFFEDIYKEKLKLFEECIPSIWTADYKKYWVDTNNIICFSKTLFESIHIIGQVDKKFIAVLDKSQNLLILFDQHAVHERIRVEELLYVYKNAKSKCEERFKCFMPQNNLSILKRHESYLSSLGLTVEFFMNGINVLEVPSCLYNKFKNDDNLQSLNKIINLLINEIIDLLKTTRGVSSKSLPKIIQNVINLEACRGAVKFGDVLNKKKSTELLYKLAKCDLPFQCAHGRPTLMSLLKLNLNEKSVPECIQFKKLLQ